MKIDLTRRVALVTGGSRGIGAAIVKMLSEAGADVAFTYNKHKKAVEVVEKIVSSNGVGCLALRLEVDQQRQVRSVVNQIIKEFGRIDILVNNVGIWTYGAIGSMSEKTWDETIAVNLKSMFLFCNEVVPHMKKQGGGRIINISSTAGQRGEAYHSHYAASKGGMIAFTKSLGPELIRDKIYVNCVSPGWVATDMTKKELSDPKVGKEIKRVIPRGCVATAEEIANCVIFLASELSNNLVGSIISANGGAVLSN